MELLGKITKKNSRDVLVDYLDIEFASDEFASLLKAVQLAYTHFDDLDNCIMRDSEVQLKASLAKLTTIAAKGQNDGNGFRGWMKEAHLLCMAEALDALMHSTLEDELAENAIDFHELYEEIWHLFIPNLGEHVDDILSSHR